MARPVEIRDALRMIAHIRFGVDPDVITDDWCENNVVPEVKLFAEAGEVSFDLAATALANELLNR